MEESFSGKSKSRGFALRINRIHGA